MTGCFVRRAGALYSVHAYVICLMAGNSAGSGAHNEPPALRREHWPCIARSVQDQPADGRSFLGDVPRTLTGEPTRGTPAARINGRRNPAQFTVAATS